MNGLEFAFSDFLTHWVTKVAQRVNLVAHWASFSENAFGEPDHQKGNTMSSIGERKRRFTDPPPVAWAIRPRHGALPQARAQRPLTIEDRVPWMIDIRAMRLRLRFTQRQFAGLFGFPVATLRKWEQQRRRPSGTALVLLHVIARYPRVVLQVVRLLRKEAPELLSGF